MSRSAANVNGRSAYAIPGIGLGLLLAAAAAVVLSRPSWLTILLALGAWLALSRDRRLGMLPAALLVALALPYDRAADVDHVTLSGIPIRPHDAILGLAMVLSLPALRRLRWSPGVGLLVALVGVGAGALVLGLMNDAPMRDLLRDARWWGLYGGGILLAGRTAPARGVLRATLVGLTVFAAVILVATLLPGIDFALKDHAVDFDAGQLRMQFGPTVFLLVPMAFWATRIVRRPRASAGAWLIYFAVAAGLSLTRVFLAVAVGVLMLAVSLAIAQSHGVTRRRVASAAGVVGLGVAGIVLALAIISIGVAVPEVRHIEAALAEPTSTPIPPATATPSPPTSPATTPGSAPAATPQPTPATSTPTPRSRGVEAVVALDRFVPNLGRLIEQSGARFRSYRTAAEIVARSPLIGHGLGQLIPVDYEFGAGDFDKEGFLPNVDNAYLTVGVKAGIVGVVALAAVLGWPVAGVWRGSRRRRAFWIPAWLGIVVLTLTQSFAVIGYSPFVLSILIAAGDASWRRARGTRTLPQDRSSDGGGEPPSAPAR